MFLNFDQKITTLAKSLPRPLYAVGGYVRNYLIDRSYSDDIDLSAPITVESLLPYLNELGMEIVAEYKRTGTVVFKSEGRKYEFTCFRKDSYDLGGAHTPERTEFTSDITEDARRRDFKCNAVYYDIARGELVDPLGGIDDINNKVLDTVVSPKQVFGHDGLRLMRLARFSGELGFTPIDAVIDGATMHAKNIKDVSAERIYDELKKILISDAKYPFSDKKGHYTGLKILDRTGVLDYIIPELALGRGMEQRKDFHDYDVLEHSLRATLYSDRSVRLAVLLHDVAKPYCKINYGRYRMHATEGASMSETVLKRLKADNKTIKKVKFLVGAHMFDLDGSEPICAVRKFIVKNYDHIEELMLVKQADHCGYKDDLAPCKVVEKWKIVLDQMRRDGTPFRIKDLKITARELTEIGVKTNELGSTLERLWLETVAQPTLNNNERLKDLAKNI